MAVYRNREVYVVGPNVMANTPESINIKYKDGSTENVSVALVYFTEAEKKELIKRHPSKFDDVLIVSDSDMKAVREGVTPSYDPAYKEQAELQARKDAEAVKLAEMSKQVSKK